MFVLPATAKKLRDVERAILAEPKAFDMDSWADQQKGCGTTCCIAGHALVQCGVPKGDLVKESIRIKFLPKPLQSWLSVNMMLFKGRTTSVAKTAERLLGLNSDQARSLFYVNNWPEEFRKQYRNYLGESLIDKRRGTPMQRAAVAVARIEHFIETGK